MRQDKNRATNGGRASKMSRSAAEEARPHPALALLSRAFFGIVFVVLLALIMVIGRPPLPVELGETSPRDFTARVPFTSTDYEAMRQVLRRRLQTAPVAFRMNGRAWSQSVEELLKGIERGEGAAAWQHLPAEFSKQAFFALLPELRSRLSELSEALRGTETPHVVAPADMRERIVRDREGGTTAYVGEGETADETTLAQIPRLDADDSRFRKLMAPALSGLAPDDADLASRAFTSVLSPSISLDVERSRMLADEVARDLPRVVKEVSQGALILAQGSEVTRQHVVDLTAERQQYWSGSTGRVLMLEYLGGVVAILVLIMAAAAIYVSRYRPELSYKKLQMLSFGLVSLGLVALARMCVIWGVTPLLVPVPLAVMIMCLVYDQHFGMDVAVFFALLVRLASPGADMEFFTLLLGGIITALLSGKVRTRSTLIKAGLLAGAAQFCAVWGLGLMAVLHSSEAVSPWNSPMLSRSLLALANGLASGFLVSGMLPAIETLFGVTTDIRLLEWSDPNQPLLQRLLLDAPGSYHHSMIVGTLAADAAEAAGANPLLARVSAYFHDVGKLKKPDYFGENLPESARNPHDDLSPTMSSLIITAHPKDGAQMAEEYGVPRVVRDIILQSHGCSVLKYFWAKARNGQNGRGDLEERSFRYRLPKPQGKEAAVVMLADAVESATRSMDSPSPGQLRNLVQDIISDRLSDGQLDESQLTITDLQRIEESLVHGLMAVFHNRVSYPGQEEAEAGLEEMSRETGATSTPQPAGGHGTGD